MLFEQQISERVRKPKRNWMMLDVRSFKASSIHFHSALPPCSMLVPLLGKNFLLHVSGYCIRSKSQKQPAAVFEETTIHLCLL